MRTIFGILAASWIVAAPLAAMADHHEGKDQGGKGGGRKGDWMARKLDLTPDQQTKMKAIGEEQRKVMQPLHDALDVQVAELRKLVNEKAADAKLTAKLDEVKKSREALEAAHRRFMEQRSQILTPIQRAKVALWMGKGGGGHRKGGWDRHHGKGGDDDHDRKGKNKDDDDDDD